MGYIWGRHTLTSFNYLTGAVHLSTLGNGNRYVRTRLRWGFHGDTSKIVDIQAIANNIVSFGLVTVVGDGTETPPNARTQAGNQSPPMQRWVFWETRSPVVSAIDGGTDLITWRDSGATEKTESQANVLATGLSSPNNLDLWATWEAVAGWDVSGSAVLWAGVEVLIHTPLPGRIRTHDLESPRGLLHR